MGEYRDQDPQDFQEPVEKRAGIFIDADSIYEIDESCLQKNSGRGRRICARKTDLSE